MDQGQALVIAGPDNSKGEFHAGRCERLSDLPDPLLHHILGFLPLKDLIRTSVLSSRWRSLWASLPNLVFSESRFPDRRRFLRYVDWALSCRDLSPVNSFSLICSVDEDAPSIYSWINFAINRKVQTLEVIFDLPTNLDISMVVPACVFRSEILTEFELEMEGPVMLPSSICLPKLRILRLSGLTFMDDGSIGSLLSAPCLEELSLCNCWHLKPLTVSALNLLYLFIEQRELSIDVTSICSVSIRAPKLQLFSYIGGHLSECEIRDASELCDAHLVLGDPAEGIYASRAHKLLKDLSAAKGLFLRYYILEEISSFPVFSRLNLLSFHTHDTMKLDSPSLLAMLNNCPCLVNLLFCGGLAVDSKNDEGILDPVAGCFLSSLKLITIEEFDATDDELSAVKIILRAAQVLQKLHIICSYYRSEASVGDLMESIQLLPRTSDQCFISLSPHRF